MGGRETRGGKKKKCEEVGWNKGRKEGRKEEVEGRETRGGKKDCEKVGRNKGR